MSDDEQFYDGMEDINRQIRRERERREFEASGGVFGGKDDDDEEEEEDAELFSVEREFMEQLREFANAPRTSYAKMLIEDDVFLPPVEALLASDQVADKLWEVIRGLEQRHIYLCNTDHLSDEALYQVLWTDLLNQETIDLSSDPSASCRLDILGGGSDDELETYLRYYADEDERREWAREFALESVPSKEAPPYDRDRFLPRPS